MEKNKDINNTDNINEILTKDEILKLYESVAENSLPIMLAKDVCKCGNGDCGCGSSGGSAGCCG